MNEIDRISWLNGQCPDGGFLQSEAWCAFEEREGHPTVHFEGEGLWANIIEYTLPVAGKYWYVPRGPVFERTTHNVQLTTGEREVRMTNDELRRQEWRKILDEAKKKGIGWIRVEPKSEEDADLLREWSKPYGVRKALHDMQPREILVVDISKSEDEILAGMKVKTRYNVRLAEKRCVEISQNRDEVSLREFLRMIRETANRNGIATHSEGRYRNFLEAFPTETLELFTARRDGRVLAAALVSFFGDTATYLHGASSDDDRGSMAPFLLQFCAMKEAKRRGCMRYDLGGVDMTGKRASLVGVTRFKVGFAETVKAISFPGTYDIVLFRSRFFVYEIFGMSKIIVKNAVRRLTKI